MSPGEPTVEPQIQTPSTTTTCPSRVPARGWRKSKWLIPAELIVVARIFLADALGSFR
jgi:hypothetical protein